MNLLVADCESASPKVPDGTNDGMSDNFGESVENLLTDFVVGAKLGALDIADDGRKVEAARLNFFFESAKDGFVTVELALGGLVDNERSLIDIFLVGSNGTVLLLIAAVLFLFESSCLNEHPFPSYLQNPWIVIFLQGTSLAQSRFALILLMSFSLSLNNFTHFYPSRGSTDNCVPDT